MIKFVEFNGSITIHETSMKSLGIPWLYSEYLNCFGVRNNARVSYVQGGYNPGWVGISGRGL